MMKANLIKRSVPSKANLRESIEVHEELNPKIWDNETMTMKEDVYDKLKNIADEFLKYVEIPLNIVDIEVVGSNASYNYNENSDIDLHIIVNNEVNYVDPEILRMLYNSKKNSFNDNYELDIDGIPVELYIEDVKDGNATNGRFSIRDNQWVVKPEPIHYDIPDIAPTLNDYVQKCNDMLKSDDAQAILDLVNEIYMMRKLGLAQEGEASVGNLVFKELRNMDMIPKLKDHYYELRSKDLSEAKEYSKQNQERNKLLILALNENNVLNEAKTDMPEVKLFKELLTKLKESNEEKAIDSVEITSFIVENDIICENIEVSDELSDMGYTRTYDIYINGDIVGYIGYVDNKWVGNLCK